MICNFCEEPLEKGTGLLYVKKDGTLFYFCSSKCRKNLIGLGREGRRQQWTRAYRIFKGREKVILKEKAAKPGTEEKKEEKPKAAPAPKTEGKKSEPKQEAKSQAK